MLELIEANPPNGLLAAMLAAQLIEPPLQWLPKLEVCLVQGKHILVFNGFYKPITHLKLDAKQAPRGVFFDNPSIRDE